MRKRPSRRFRRFATQTSRCQANNDFLHCRCILVHSEATANHLMLGENDNLLAGSGRKYHASKTALFLPVAIIAAGYAALFTWLFATGNADGGMGRLSLVVLSAGIPFLVAHAVLRYFTIQIRMQPHALLLHTGFPRSEPYHVPYRLIQKVSIRRGIGGRIAGSGTLVFRLVSGQKITICDLEDPQAAYDEIETLLDGDGGPLTNSAEPAEMLPFAASDR